MERFPKSPAAAKLNGPLSEINKGPPIRESTTCRADEAFPVPAAQEPPPHAIRSCGHAGFSETSSLLHG